MATLLRLLMPVIMFVTQFGGIVGGIWAASSGDWWAIWYTLLACTVSHLILGILLLPSAGIGRAAITAFKRGHLLTGRVLSGAGSLYVAALMAAWTLLTTVLFLGHHRQSSLLPILLLGYTSASAPWVYMAGKEKNGGSDLASTLYTVMMQAGYVVAGMLLLLNPENGPGTFLLVIVVTLLIGWVGQQQMLAEIFTAAANEARP
jgi:hypothetical protein